MEITRLTAVATYIVVPLIDASNRPSYRASPTLAAGDVKIIRHTGGAWDYSNPGTLPAIIGGSATKQILITLTATEMTSDNLDYPIIIQFIDQTATKEWDDQEIIIWTKQVPSNLQQILGIAVSTPATAGILDVNIKNIANAVVNTASAQLGVNVINAAGTAWASGAITDSVFGADTYPRAIRTAATNGAGAGYVDLDGSASSVDNFYVGCSIKITSGTGAGQSRTIILYVGSTKRAYVDRIWVTNPTIATYLINIGKLTLDVLNVGIATAGGASTITLATSAVATNEYYDGAKIFIISGTGLGQSRIIATYVGSTRVATVTDIWATQPDSTSVYSVIGLGDVEVGINNDKTGYSLAATQAVNVTQIDGAVLATHATGMMPSDVRDALGNAVTTTANGILDVNAKNINNVSTASVTTINANQGTTQPLNFTGTGASALVKVDVTDIATAAVSTSTAQLGVNLVNIAGSPVSTTTAQLGTNVVSINAVAASSVTTINANQGTTQPINFTGTAASALVKSDMIDVASAAVSTSTAQIGTNVVSTNNIDFTALEKASLNASTPASITGAVGSVTGNVGGNVVGSVASVTGNVGGNVVGSVASVTARVTANTDQLAGQTVTAAAGVTFPTSVASPTNITAGTITTVTNLTNAPTAGDFTATMKTSLNSSTPASITGAVGSVTGNVGGNVVGSVASVTGNVAGSVNSVTNEVSANVTHINAVSTSAVTTVNANQGTTQPVNFTSTGVNALVKGDIIDIAGSTVSTSAAQVGVNVVSTNNIDFTALEKTSLNAATPASVTGSVGSVTGNVGGNVVGSVGSVTAAVTVGTNNDKTGYALTAAYDAAKTASSQSSVDAVTVDLVTITVNQGTMISDLNTIKADLVTITTDVLAIPTNPLLTNDARITEVMNELDAIGVDLITITNNQALQGTLANDDIIKADLVTITADILAIPTNPLLTNDSRITETINDLNAIKADLVTITTNQSYQATLANQNIIIPDLVTITNNQGTMISDLNDIKADLVTITTDVLAIPTNPLLTNDSRITTIISDLNGITADLVTITTDVNAIPTNPLLTTDSRLNNLNATISSRAVPGDAMALVNDAITASKFDESTAFPISDLDSGVTRIARTGADGDTLETLSDQSDSILTEIGGIQNNTRFVCSVPVNLRIPDSSYLVYMFHAMFYALDGSPLDPDSNEMAIRLRNVAGTEKTALYDDAVVTIPSTASITFSNYYKMVRVGIGHYDIYYKLVSTETIDQWIIDFAMNISAVQFDYTRTTLVVLEEPGVATLADSNTNKTIIAKAMKDQNVSSTTAITGSVEKDILTNPKFDEIVADLVTITTNQASQATLSNQNIILADLNTITVDLNTITVNQGYQATLANQVDVIIPDLNTLQAEIDNVYNNTMSMLPSLVTITVNQSYQATSTQADNIQSSINTLTSDVSAIPTNPLLTNDSRLQTMLDDLAEAIADLNTITTNQADQATLDNQNIIMADLNTITTDILAIPTNPLLTNDSRISTILADLVTITTDINAIPTNPLLTTDSRIDAIVSDLNTITTDVLAIPTNPFLTNDSRIDTVLADLNTITSDLDAISLDLNTITTDVLAIPTNPLLDNDSRIDEIITDLNTITITQNLQATLNNQNIIMSDLNTITVDLVTITNLVTDIPSQVWDEPIVDHLDSGSTGASLNAAGSAGDPWATTLPGSYGDGSAGKILGVNLDAKISDIALDLNTITIDLNTITTNISNIPTNPLLDNDPRIDSIIADLNTITTDVLAIPTNPLLTNDSRITTAINDLTEILADLVTITTAQTDQATIDNQNIIINDLNTITVDLNTLSIDVNNIPINPLLDNDSRIDAIVADLNTITTDVLAIPTNPLLDNDSRIDEVLADLNTITVDVLAIPTNPLLTNDSRITTVINDLDEIKSDLVTITTVQEDQATLDNQSYILNDLDEIKSDLITITDVQTHQATVENQNIIMADLNTITVDLNTITSDLNNISLDLNTITIVQQDQATIDNQNTMITDLNNIYNIIKIGGTGDNASIKAITDKLSTMLEASGPNWTYTIDALRNAPFGPGLTMQTIRDSMALDLSNTMIVQDGSIDEMLNEIDAVLGGYIGSVHIIIHLQNTEGAPIFGGYIQVFDNSLLTMQTAGNTNVDGNLSITLNPGNYKVLISKQGVYTFNVPESMTVTTSTTVTFVGTALPPVPPITNCQLVYLYPVNVSNVTVTCADITVQPQNDNEIISPYFITHQRVKMEYIPARLRFEANLIKGANVIIEGKAYGEQFIYGRGQIDSDNTKNLIDYDWIDS
jgi:hypothetical protein